MRCREVGEKLELYVLGGLAADEAEALSAHLAHCERCRAAEDHCRLLLGEIELAGERVEPGLDFERRLRSAVDGAIAGERRRWRLGRVVSAVASAAAVLALGVVLWRAFGTRGRRAPGAAGGQAAGLGSGPLAELWRFSEVQAAQASAADRVVVNGSSLYVLRRQASGCSVVAVDMEAGRAHWETPCDGLGYLATDGTRVYCLVSRGRRGVALKALAAADGRPLWHYAAGARRRLVEPSRPIPLAGDRVCWTAGGAVHLLDGRAGSLVWTREIAGEGPLSRVASSGDTLFVASGKALHCLDATSGREAWAEPLADAPAGLGRPLVAVRGGVLYAVQPRRGGGPELCCVDLASRSVLWRRRVPGASCLLADAERVYVRGRRVVALHGRTGEPLWRRPASGCGPLTHTGGLLHFVDSTDSGCLVALEGSTGRTVWRMAGIRSCGAFVRVGCTGFIKTRDGVVHALAMCGRGRS